MQNHQYKLYRTATFRVRVIFKGSDPFDQKALCIINCTCDASLRERHGPFCTNTK